MHLHVDLQLPNGGLATLELGSFAPAFELRLWVASDRGKMVSLRGLSEVEYADEELLAGLGLPAEAKRWTCRWTPSPLASDLNGYSAELRTFVSGVRAGKGEEVHPTLAETLPLYALMDEIEELVGAATA